MNLIYNRLGYRISSQALDFAAAVTGGSIKALLLRSTSTYVPDADHDVLDPDILGAGAVELSVASYARLALSGVAVTIDDTNDRTKFDVDDLSWATLESGQTVKACLIYEEVTNDFDSIPLLYIDGKINVTLASPATQATSGSITGATQANPCVITSNGHGLVNGQKVKIASVGGMTQLNGNIYTVAGAATNTFQLSGVNSGAYGAYTSGGTWQALVNLYVDPITQGLPSGAAMDFGGGATCTLNGAHASGVRVLEVVAFAADADVGDVASNVQSTLSLPAILGGGAFNINLSASGLFAIAK